MFFLSHCPGPPSHIENLVHRSKVRSIVGGCIGVHLPGERMSDENECLYHEYMDSVPLPYKMKHSFYGRILFVAMSIGHVATVQSSMSGIHEYHSIN